MGDTPLLQGCKTPDQTQAINVQWEVRLVIADG